MSRKLSVEELKKLGFKVFEPDRFEIAPGVPVKLPEKRRFLGKIRGAR